MSRRAVGSAPTRWRWVLWGLLATGFLLVSFHRVTSAVLAGDLTRAFDTTGAELGFLHAAFFYIYAALQIPSGVLVDRAGSRRVATGGLLVMSVGVFVFALAESYLVAFAARALIGLGGAVLYTAALRFLANWYRPDEFATMTGWTVAASGVGALLATTPLAVAVEVSDWRTVVGAVGVVGVALALATALLVRDHPDDVDATVPGVGSTPTETDLAAVVANTRVVLRDPVIWLLGLTMFLVLGTNFTVLGLWGVPYVADLYSVDVRTASTVVLVANLGFLLGSPAFGTLSDRFESRSLLVAGSTVVFALAYVVIFLTVTPPLPVVGLLFFLAMFVNGGVILSYTVAKERHAASASATVTGTINSMGWFGAAVFPGLVGLVLDAYWTGDTIAGSRVYTAAGYRVAFGIAAATGLVAVCCAGWLHYRGAMTSDGSTPAPSDD